MRLLPFALAAFALTAPHFGIAADPDPWSIYMAARQRAGGGSEPGHLVNYSYEIVSTLPAGDSKVEIRGTVAVILPNLIRQELETPQGLTQLIFDGTNAWQILGGKHRDLPEDAARLQRAELARRHILFEELPAKQLLRYRRQEDVNGRPTDVIEIIDVGGAPLRLYIDTETKDLLKQVFVGDIPGGGMAQVEETYSEYVEVNGLRFASRSEVLRNGVAARTSVLRDIRVNSEMRRDLLLR